MGQQQGGGGTGPPAPPHPLGYEGALPAAFMPPPPIPGGLYPSAVPVVGITPSQMVANIFCAAAAPPKTNPPFAPPGVLTPPRPLGPPETTPDPFEVQWAALGAKPPPPPPPNPFAGDLQKTFEIEL